MRLCIFISSLVLLFSGCNSSSSKKNNTNPAYSLNLSLARLASAGLDPFVVTATLLKNGSAFSGQTLALSIPRGSVSAITDNGNGTYTFTVTPATAGIHPITVSYADVNIRRDAIVTNNILTSAGQPQLVPGLVNTEGYEDGITITPDGEYLFVQYGPLYFSGIFLHSSICAEAGWSLYDLTTCLGKNDSNWVFDTIGPYNTSSRPRFPEEAISGGQLNHLNIVVPGVANKIALFPTVFYGFKRQADGTFAEPFKVAFNDSKGTNGPFGLSFQMTSATTARFALSWNNYFSDLGDDKPDIYQGVMTLGQDQNLGDVVYAGDFFASITPYISPVSFSSHVGVQGNPHLYSNGAGNIESIWTDDEQVSHDLTVYNLTAGTFPSGTWSATSLPTVINTPQSESQPFFTGSRLYLNRNTTIVYHEYLGGNYSLNSSWGPEVVVLGTTDTSVGSIYGFGEPTLASYGGKTYLYFAFIENRASGMGAGRYDYNLGAGFIELP